MDDADPGLEGSAEPLYHPVRRPDATQLNPNPFTQNSGHPPLTPLLAGASPDDVEGRAIVDPACGSGSFLIQAFQFLLDWHLEWYCGNSPQKFAKGKSPRLLATASGVWRLTVRERKRILLNNIFGVDIDPQAVEVTKLSLLLKVLEGENFETLHGTGELFHERVLPDLGRNIKCGNSLVGSDVFESDTADLLNDARFAINAFDWEVEFPSVAANGGFDAVIGNPPYVYRNAMNDELRTYFESNYSAAQGNFDLYKFFLERGLRLLRTNGRLGMIVSSSFLVQPSFSKLRELLLDQSLFELLAPLGPGVFEGATIDTTVLLLQKCAALPASHRCRVLIPKVPTHLATAKGSTIKQSRFRRNAGGAIDYKLSDKGSELLARLEDKFPTIETGFEFGVGINTGFIRDELVSETRIDKRYHRMVAGNGISRYGLVQTEGWIMFDADYIRSRGDRGRSLPAEKFMSNEKILVVRTRNLSLERRVIATLDSSRNYNLNRLSNIIARPGFSIYGLLGILNSSLFQWMFSTRYYDYEIKPVYLRASPMADCNDARLVDAVRNMLSSTRAAENAVVPSEQERALRAAKDLDKRIDSLVLNLYGVTPEELEVSRSAVG